MTADNLINLLDALTETSIYVIEEDSHRLLYFNKRCQETGRQKAGLGSPCHQVWPEHCDNCPLKEEQWLWRFSRIYAQSLVTVFGECIIVNLTADYYVNCQKDAMWTDIPEHGNFDSENRRYSRQVLHPDDLEQFEQ